MSLEMKTGPISKDSPLSPHFPIFFFRKQAIMKVFPFLATLFPFAFLVAASGANLAVAGPDPTVIQIENRTALVHLGSLDSFDITKRGVEAAALLLDFLEKGDRSAAERAISIYKQIIPSENFGGEYTALQWFLECSLADETERNEKFLRDPFAKRFYRVLMADNARDFRNFIRDKYHLPGGARTKAEQKAKPINRFMEDLILFANPRRESWEKSSKMIAALHLEPGETVADVGAGPGYFTFKFARQVGPKGKVFAIERNRMHLRYLTESSRELHLNNVEPVYVDSAGLGITTKVDVIFFCSVYHNLYTAYGDDELVLFFNGLRNALKPGGRLVIADNGPVSSELPYHGPYIDRQLIISQLHYAGFDLVQTDQFIPQRYMLTFKMRNDSDQPWKLPPYTRPVIPSKGLVAKMLQELPPTHDYAEFIDGNPERIRVLTPRSLVPTVGAFPGFSKEARKVARHFLAALESKDREDLLRVSMSYKELAAIERTGDDYSALGWLCDYLLASESQRAALRSSAADAEFYDFFAANDFERLKAYLIHKYLLGKFERHYLAIQGLLSSDRDGELQSETGPPTAKDGYTTEEPPPLAVNGRWISPDYSKLRMDISYTTLLGWIEYMAFSDPTREEWEKTTQMIDFLDLQRGQSIADIGAGAGYFSFRFAKRVGPKGRIYALDTAQEQIDNIRRVAEKNRVNNVYVSLSKENDVMLPEDSIDVAFLCSIYHAIYVTSIEYVRDEFIYSIRKALRPDGRLVIVENEPIPFESHGFFGPRMTKELIIAQLLHYGFTFEAFAQFVPERYVLVFRMPAPPGNPPSS